MAYMDIWKQYLAGEASADTAHNQKYQNILGVLSNQGAASKARLRRSASEERSRGQAALRARGMAGTSVADSQSRGLFSRVAEQEGLIDESVANRLAGVMQAHEVARPNAGMFSNMMGLEFQNEQQQFARQQQKKKDKGWWKGLLGGALGVGVGAATGGLGAGIGGALGGLFTSGLGQPQYTPGYGQPPWA